MSQDGCYVIGCMSQNMYLLHKTMIVLACMLLDARQSLYLWSSSRIILAKHTGAV